MRFGMPVRAYDERTCLIVVQVDEHMVALVVDRVNDVAEIPDSMIEPPPRSRSKTSHYISGMGKVKDTVKILLNLPEVLSDPALTVQEEGLV